MDVLAALGQGGGPPTCIGRLLPPANSSRPTCLPGLWRAGSLRMADDKGNPFGEEEAAEPPAAAVSGPLTPTGIDHMSTPDYSFLSCVGGKFLPRSDFRWCIIVWSFGKKLIEEIATISTWGCSGFGLLFCS